MRTLFPVLSSPCRKSRKYKDSHLKRWNIETKCSSYEKVSQDRPRTIIVLRFSRHDWGVLVVGKFLSVPSV